MSFFNIATVALRESLEAFLVIGILTGMVARLGTPEARRPILLGAIGGFLVSIVAGIAVIAGAEELIEEGGEFVEVAAGLLAVAILTYMVLWMYRHTQDLLGALHHKTKQALADGRMSVLAGLAFVAVLREGVETAAFIATDHDAWLITAAAVAAGIGVGAILAYLIFSGIVRLNIRTFFAVTGAVLVGFAGYLIFKALAELAEEALGLGEAGEIGVIVIAVAYVAAMGYWLILPMVRRARMDAAASAAAE